MLYIVATPIGNLGDMTYRAVEVLKHVDTIIAEDTRQTKKLLDHYNITGKKLISFHAQSSSEKAEALCREITQSTQPWAYVSDAGTPCVSDPGFSLVRAAIRQNITVLPLPGASALTSLVSVAGVPVDSFVWHGFLPHKKGRQTLLKSLLDTEESHIFFESVHRFLRLLDELNEYLGADRIIVVGRELTKLHEEIFRGSIANAKKYFTSANIRGEFVVLVAPAGYTL